MEPPPYNEHGNHDPLPIDAINWDEVLPYITPQKITPQMYEALLVLSKHLLEKFAKEETAATLMKIEFDYSAHALDLSWSRILWEIVHIFSESQLFFKFQLLMGRLLEAWTFRHVCCVRIISLLSGT
jgi:hypothetical protein